MDDKMVTFTAEFPLDRMNRNGRIYTSECIEKAIAEEHIQEGLRTGTLMGGFAKQQTGDLSRDLSINPAEAAFSIKKLSVEKNEKGTNLVAGLSTLPNHLGALIKHDIHTKVTLSLAPRGVGEIKMVDGIPTVQPGYRMITCDIVTFDQEGIPDTERIKNNNE